MKILIVQTGFLGDVILSTPVIAEAASLYPDARITVMTTPQAAGLVRHHPQVSEVIVFDKRGADAGWPGLQRMSRRLREENFAAVYSLHKSWRTALLLWLSGIPQRFGFREAAGSFLYTRRARRSDLPHDVLRNLAIFRCLGREPRANGQKLLVVPSPEAKQRAGELLREAGLEARVRLAGMAPGSVWPTKRWTTSGFAETARMLSERGWKVVLIGGPDDKESAAEIERTAGVPLVNLTGRTDLLTSAALIAHFSVLVTNDSAPMHLAAAAGVPTAAVFCATVPEFGYGPWNVRHEVLGEDELSCRPCAKHGGKRCPTGTYACQRLLPAARVVEAVERLTTGPGSHRGTAAGEREAAGQSSSFSTVEDGQQ